MIDAHRAAASSPSIRWRACADTPKRPVYGAMKAAAAHFTTCLAVDLGRHGIPRQRHRHRPGTDPAGGLPDRLRGRRRAMDVVGARGTRRMARRPSAHVALFSPPTQSAFVTGHARIPSTAARKPAVDGSLTAGGPLRQPLEEPVNVVDETVDVLVAGSGGSRAPIAREGLWWHSSGRNRPVRRNVRLLRWGRDVVPCNPVLVRAGSDDTIAEALRYYRNVVGDRTPAELRRPTCAAARANPNTSNATSTSRSRSCRGRTTTARWPGPVTTACVTSSQGRCPTTALAGSKGWFVDRWITNASVRRSPTCSPAAEHSSAGSSPQWPTTPPSQLI